MSIQNRPLRAASKLARSLHTSASFRSSRNASLCRINAANMHCSQDLSHVLSVHSNLISHGLVNVHLGFSDDKSQYLQQLILQLHKRHGHGLPIDHSSSRGWFWDVRPTPEEQVQINSSAKSETPSPSPRARSETMMSFPWHTDCSYEASPPRFFGLHVLQPDRCGGGVLSVLAVENLVKSLSPSSKEILSKPYFRIAVPPEFVKNKDERHITGSLLHEVSSGAVSGANPWLRFREDVVSPLSPEAATALADFKDILHGPQIQEKVLHLTPEDLPQGSVILIDNRRWLHARNEVKDPGRHLRRVRWDAIPFTADGGVETVAGGAG
ncbi:Clavaminate synthase-like protein [Cadophora sp. DSE1049]|nr:Clavaminate synthase-like protein [Cadophora sp. DSE1049]